MPYASEQTLHAQNPNFIACLDTLCATAFLRKGAVEVWNLKDVRAIQPATKKNSTMVTFHLEQHQAREPIPQLQQGFISLFMPWSSAKISKAGSLNVLSLGGPPPIQSLFLVGWNCVAKRLSSNPSLEFVSPGNCHKNMTLDTYHPSKHAKNAKIAYWLIEIGTFELVGRLKLFWYIYVCSLALLHARALTTCQHFLVCQVWRLQMIKNLTVANENDLLMQSSFVCDHYTIYTYLHQSATVKCSTTPLHTGTFPKRRISANRVCACHESEENVRISMMNTPWKCIGLFRLFKLSNFGNIQLQLLYQNFHNTNTINTWKLDDQPCECDSWGQQRDSRLGASKRGMLARWPNMFRMTSA